jgi:hypothetical protein
MRDRGVLRLVDALSSLSAVTRRRIRIRRRRSSNISSSELQRSPAVIQVRQLIAQGNDLLRRVVRHGLGGLLIPGPADMKSCSVEWQRRPSEARAAFEACQSCLLYSHRDGRISAATIRGRFPDLRRILRPIGAPFPVPRRAGRKTDRETGVSRFPGAGVSRCAHRPYRDSRERELGISGSA